MGTLLPPVKVAQRLMLLLVSFVIVPGVVLTWYGIQAVAQEESIEIAALRQRADDLGVFLAQDLGERMGALQRRLEQSTEAAAGSWEADPAVAAGRILATEPRVQAVVLVGADGRARWPIRPPPDDPAIVLAGRLVSDCSTAESDVTFDLALRTLTDDARIARAKVERASCVEGLTRWEPALRLWEGAELGPGADLEGRSARSRLGQVRALIGLMRIPEAAGRSARLLAWLVEVPWTWGGRREAAVGRDLLELLADGVLLAQVPPSELAGFEHLRERLRDRISRQEDEAAVAAQLPGLLGTEPHLASGERLVLTPVRTNRRTQLVGLVPTTFHGEAVTVVLHLDDRTLRADLDAKIATANRANPKLEVSVAQEDLGPPARASGGFQVLQPLGPWFPGDTLLVTRAVLPEAEVGARQSRALRVGALLGTFLLVCSGVLVIARAVGKEVEIARLKSDFVSSVSHELRTPLTTIRIMGEMLSLGAVTTPEKQQEYYRNIVSEAERLTRLINNVLDFARIEEGRKKFQMGMGDLADAVYEVERITGDYVRSEGFVLKTTVDPDLPATAFDRDAIIQALINLMSNAVKYSKDDKRVEMGARLDGEQVVLSVRDFGPGIDSKDVPHLFEKFWRGGDSLTREVGGTGLGLSIVAHIAEAHGGRVGVETQPGQGSTFLIHLPVRSLPEPQRPERRR